MIKYRLLLGLTIASLLFVQACKSSDPEPNDGNQNTGCASKNLTLTADITGTKKCESTGSISLHASGSSGYEFDFAAGGFGKDSVFTNLAAGSYTVVMKDKDGCTKTETFVVQEEGTKGANFSIVSSMINAKCNLACHNNGIDGAPIGIFSDDCKIVARKNDIKTKAYDGDMGNLDAGEKDKILTWINSGGTYTD